MKKALKKLFAALLAVALVVGGANIPATTASAAEDGYLMFVAFGGDKDASGDWGLAYTGTDNDAVTGTTAYVQAGDTVTIGLNFANPVVHTWYMAPVFVGEGITELDYTINDVTVDGVSVMDQLDFTLGEKAWWYEGTGDYTAEQAIRLKGGYNEWAAQAFTASPEGCKEIMYNITINKVVNPNAPVEAPVFVAFGGDKDASGDWGLAYTGTDNDAVTGTTAVAKEGETVTVGLTFANPVVHTWYMAPTFVAEGITEFEYTVDDVTIDGVSVLDQLDFTLGEKAWWYEGTGDYTAEQAIRIKGGYNEWAAQAFTASPEGFKEIMYTITVTKLKAGSAAAGEATLSTESYPAYIAIGADSATGSWDLCYDGGDANGFTAVTGELKSGETTVLSLTAPSEIAYTWYVAPFMVVEDSSLIDETSTFDVKVYLDDAEIPVDLAAGKLFWAEGTGAYAAEQCVRIAGGFNEWGDKYIAESPKNYTKITFEITPTIYVKAAAPAAPVNEYDPNGEYNVYLRLQTPNWTFRDGWNEANGIGSENWGQWIKNNDSGATFGVVTDAKIQGNGTYTVSITDFGTVFADDFAAAGQEYFNILGLSTDLPLNDGISITNVVTKMDGKEIDVQEVAYQNPDSKELYDVVVQNKWNSDKATIAYYAAPTTSIEITFTISGFAYDNANQAPAEGTDTPAVDTPAVDTPVVEEPTTEGGNDWVIYVVVAVVVVAAVVAGVLVSKKKKAAK